MQAANRGDTLKFLERMSPPRRRLDWAVEYASTDLARLPLWRVEELRRELRLFVGFAVGLSADNDLVDLPNDTEMSQAQQGLREMIVAALKQETALVGNYHTTLSLIYVPRMATGPDDDPPLEPRLLEEGKYDLPVPVVARWQLAATIVEQARIGVTIKQCPGPLPRRRVDMCGRWFVGTPKKRYCSPRCQMRGTDRTRRAKVL